MSTHQDINAFRAQRIANTHDPLELMENTQTPFHPDQSSHITYIQHPQPNSNFVQQPSFNTNYMPQPMQNPEDSSDPTTPKNTTLALLAKAFKFNTIPTNNNQRSSLIPRNSQIAQLVKPRKRDAVYLQQQLQIALEEEAKIQSTQEKFEFMAVADAYEESERVKVNCTSEDTLQQASTSGTQSDNAPIYDSDGSTESWKVCSVICSTNNSNGENQVVSKSSVVTTADASDKHQQQQDSTSSTSTLTTTITAGGNFDL
nr:hypothetical protein [Tanacetum cinerariifolium]